MFYKIIFSFSLLIPALVIASMIFQLFQITVLSILAKKVKISKIIIFKPTAACIYMMKKYDLLILLKVIFQVTNILNKNK